MNHPRNFPDPSIDWDYISYKYSSDSIRPEKGYRICKKCNRTLPINSWNFNRNKNSPDGFAYICKECNKKYMQKYNKSKRED